VLALQRQRVAIGRAITRDPKVFLFDEPLSNLDAALRVATRIEITNLKEALPETTMIYVTHDQVEAMTLADRIVVFNSGRIEQVGAAGTLSSSPKSLCCPVYRLAGDEHYKDQVPRRSISVYRALRATRFC
jgi:ABC-type sugar transport system ATPase subunit